MIRLIQVGKYYHYLTCKVIEIHICTVLVEQQHKNELQTKLLQIVTIYDKDILQNSNEHTWMYEP